MARARDPRRDDPVIKQLVGFQRVHLAAGASVVVEFAVNVEQLALVDRLTGDRVLAPGLYVPLCITTVLSPRPRVACMYLMGATLSGTLYS